MKALSSYLDREDTHYYADEAVHHAENLLQDLAEESFNNENYRIEVRMGEVVEESLKYAL